MGGKSKSNTGIQIIDEAVDKSVGAVQGAAKNVERNVGDSLNEMVSLTKPGGLNNFGAYVVRSALRTATLGTVNPEQLKGISGKTGAEQKAEDMASDAAAAETAALLAAQIQEVEGKKTAVRTKLAEFSKMRERAPGRQQTLLTSMNSQPGKNTLLTMSK